MTFNLTDAIQVILIAAVASVVLSSGICPALPKAKKAFRSCSFIIRDTQQGRNRFALSAPTHSKWRITQFAIAQAFVYSAILTEGC